MIFKLRLILIKVRIIDWPAIRTFSDKFPITLAGLVSNSSNKAAKNDQLQEFFQDVEVANKNISIIKEASRKISDINQNVVQATTPDKESDYSQELQSVISETNKKAAFTKQLLTKMQEDTKRMRTSNQNNGAKAQADIRLRENMFNTLTRKFVDVMKEYQNAQTKYKTDIKKKVKRQVQIVKPDATTEEIDAVFKAGGGAGDVFKNAILTVSLFLLWFSSSVC